MGGFAVGEQSADGGDHHAGSSHAVPVGGELGEVAQPPRRILQRRRHVVGLVTSPVLVALPAPAAQAVALLAGHRPARRTGPCWQWTGRWPRARTAPARRRANEPWPAAARAGLLRLGGFVTTSTGLAPDACLEPQHVPAVNAGA